MSKKKIAFLVNSLSHGGAERVISNLSNALIERFDITIVTFQKSTPFYNLDKRIKVIACTETIKTPTSTYQSLKLNYTFIKQVYRTIKSERISLIIGFITSANITATIAAKFSNIPCVICDRSNPLTGNPPRFWRLLKKHIYPIADHLVVQTQGVKKIFEKSISPNKITVLPNPIAKELTSLRNGQVKKEKIILTVGRLDQNKNQKDSIKAFSLIGETDWKLLIIGDGDKKQELIELIEHLNLRDRVTIISKIKDIDTYYNKASIFVFSSKTEGFPNALLEAMHFGLPCVSTDCNFGPSDLINHGTNGYLVPINKEVILSERLMQLIDNEDLRFQFSLKAKLATEKYQSSQAVAQWEDLINTLLTHNVIQ